MLAADCNSTAAVHASSMADCKPLLALLRTPYAPIWQGDLDQRWYGSWLP